MNKIAVIGLGCAGYHGIKALRENGWTGQIHVYSDGSFSAANPMLTTYYVSGKIPREAMFPFGSLQKLQEDYDVTVHIEEPVTHVDTASMTLLLGDRRTESFDQILISTGARAVSPDLGQGGHGRTFLMRTVKDADALKKELEEKTVRSALVVGASMVGIKVAELFYERGIKVAMADMAERLFPLACMTETAQILEQELEAKGIRLLLQRGVKRVEESEDSVKTWLTDGECIETDLLVLCIGTRANVELAANTEVVQEEPVLVNRGIVVNEKMQTNIPGIYAAGDCCEALNIQTGTTMIIGLWANAAEQGRVAGCNMAGVEALYEGSIPSNITHYFNQTFIGIGDPNLPGTRYVWNGKEGVVTAICEDGCLQCVNILGNYRISGMVKEYLMDRIRGQKDPVTLSDVGFLRSSGLPEELIGLLG